MAGEGGHQGLPPFGVVAEEDIVGETVAGDVPRRDRIPSVMLDGDASLIADRLEPHLDLRQLTGGETRLPLGEGYPLAGFPDGDASDLEDGSVGQSLGEVPADAGLEGELAGRLAREVKQGIGPPPCA